MSFQDELETSRLIWPMRPTKLSVSSQYNKLPKKAVPLRNHGQAQVFGVGLQDLPVNILKILISPSVAVAIIIVKHLTERV